MVLTGLKERTVAAKTGHSLLKRKSDAIKANLNLILKEILDVKKESYLRPSFVRRISLTLMLFFTLVFSIIK